MLNKTSANMLYPNKNSFTLCVSDIDVLRSSLMKHNNEAQ